VSLAVPEPYGSLLQRRRAGFGDTQAFAIPTHVTLLPPTEIDPSGLPAFREHLAAVAAATRAFPMRLSGTDTFRPLSPVVYVSLAEGARECDALQQRVRSGPVRRDLQFPYHPHVTVAHNVPEPALDRAQSELAAFAASWTATGFALYEQDDSGVWRRLGDHLFGADAPGAAPGDGSAGGAAAGSPAGPAREFAARATRPALLPQQQHCALEAAHAPLPLTVGHRPG
jgi:2'-5' RNA ligase